MKRFLILAFLMMFPATAGAQIAVLGFEAEPGAEDMAKWVSQSLRFWVKARNIKLGPEKDGMEVKLVYGCEDVPEKPACMAKIAKAMGVNRLIFGKVRRKGSVYAVTIKSLSMKRPKNLETMSKRVQVSGASYAGVKNIAGGWLDSLLGKAATGTLVITGTPPGAMVSVNGKEVGPLPATGRMELNLPGGSHTISLTKEGFEKSDQSVRIRVGRSRKVSLELKKMQGVTPRPRPEDLDVKKDDHTDKDQEPFVEKKKKPTNPKLWWQISFYSTAGVAASLLVASIFTGRKVSDLEGQKTSALKEIRSQDPNATWISSSDVCSSSEDSEIDGICKDGKKYANMTNAFLITGGVFAAAAGVLSYFAFVRDYETEESVSAPVSENTTRKTPVRVSANPVMYGNTGAGFNLRLDF